MEFSQGPSELFDLIDTTSNWDRDACSGDWANAIAANRAISISFGFMAFLDAILTQNTGVGMSADTAD